MFRITDSYKDLFEYSIPHQVKNLIIQRHKGESTLFEPSQGLGAIKDKG